MNSINLTFQGASFDVITRDGQSWLGSTQIGLALKYANAETAITKIFNRHADEFTEKMTALVELATPGGKQFVRIFSLRGAHLLAMFARTTVAKAFRVWVLDVLDAEVVKQNHDCERTKLAYAIANEAVKEVQQAVFDAVMAGDDDWKFDRWLLSFSYGRDNKRTQPHAAAIDRKANVISLEKLAEAIAIQGNMMPSNTELADLASACNQRLALRMKSQADQRAAKTVGV